MWPEGRWAVRVEGHEQMGWGAGTSAILSTIKNKVKKGCLQKVEYNMNKIFNYKFF